jgi:Tat protein translocase TatB subunit
MFYLFIFESIGTSELVLIGLVALIVFGPRKIPELAKMFGKTMTDLRKTTTEFKQTWEREVQFEELNEIKQDVREIKELGRKIPATVSLDSLGISETEDRKPLEAPSVREVDQSVISEHFGDQARQVSPVAADQENDTVTEPPPVQSGKQDWL